MDHAITVGNIVTFVLIVGGLVVVGGVCIAVLCLLNPFRTGH